MKKIGTGLIFVLLFLVFFNPPVLSRAAEAFTIEEYHVDMKVTRENTYQITEKLKVNFTQSRHGIYRDIPLTNQIRRSDGSKGTTHAKVKNISCSDPCSTSIQGESIQLKIGNKNSYISGEKEYTISYDYVLGNDILAGNDEFYYNIIGTQWTTTISNVSFSIQMPDSFEEKNIGMSHGPFGTENPQDFKYSLEGNTIQCKLKKNVILQPGDAVTVRILLPEGYFLKTNGIPLHMILTGVLGIISIILSFVLWRIYGRDDLVVETVEFYPPEEGNSLDLAFLYKGRAEGKDVVSLVVYLAQKGYLDIVEGDHKGDFVFMRRKFYDGTDACERHFMLKLFETGDIVRKKDLSNTFYKTVKQITAMKNSKVNREKIFYASSLNKGWILWLFCLAIYAGTVFPTVYEYTFSLHQAVAASFSGLMLMVVFFMIAKPSDSQVLVKIVTSLFFLVLKGGVFFAEIYPAFVLAGKRYLGEYIFAVLSIGITMFFDAFMSKRTEYGTMILGRIRGFRNFLEVAEKDRLESLVEENPQYFFDILPYAYVLGVSDKWMKKFESIAIEPPTWYGGGYRTFHMASFHHFMSSTMSSAAASMTSSPRSSGGGISGGGSGGGGGGSW